MLTAEQARQYANVQKPEYWIKKILEKVEEAAKNGKTEIRTYLCGFGDVELYNHPPSKLQLDVIEGLTKLGYKVRDCHVAMTPATPRTADKKL